MVNNKIEFTSRMSRGETIAAVAYLPVHVFLLPLVLGIVMLKGGLDIAGANVLIYIIGAVYMLLFQWKFLRREFDPLCDGMMNTLVQICICYGLMMCFNLCVNLLIEQLVNLDNPNNGAIVDMAGMEYGKIFAMSVFLAPIVEELIFRAGIFGWLRRYNRVLGYAVSMLLFSVYHVWGYAVDDPTQWIYVIQYLPISYLLCRCYERTNTIWGSIFLHMLINGISLQALMALQEML